MKLFSHQAHFLSKNPKKALLVWETGTGKTLAALLWLKKQSYSNAFIICPKSILGRWKKDLLGYKINADVFTFDQVKKINLNKYDLLIADEAHALSSPLFDKNRSQRATTIYNWVKAHPSAPVLLLTATPVRSTPWNIHTLACYLGIFWPVKEFRQTFFYFSDLFGVWHWEKKSDWRKRIRPYVEQISDIVLMQDLVDVPVQHERIIDVAWTKEQEKSLPKEYQEPIAAWHARHRAENGKEKFKAMMEIANGYRKVMVVCRFRQQLDDFQKWLGEDRQSFVLHGGVKDQEAVIHEAREADDCIFFVQSDMGLGWEAPEFSAVIFASMSFSYVSHQQMLGRVKRINALHENTFYYLLGGECDKAVFDTIRAGKDFDPLVYLKR